MRERTINVVVFATAQNRLQQYLPIALTITDSREYLAPYAIRKDPCEGSRQNVRRFVDEFYKISGSVTRAFRCNIGMNLSRDRDRNYEICEI